MRGADRTNRNRIATSARGVGVACLVGALAACSSSGHKGASSTTRSTATSTTTTTVVATTTTLPSASSITTVKAWFAAHGQPLLAFERVTDPLATGEVPTAAACLKFLRTDLPKITSNQNTLVALAEQIPNKFLAIVVKNDVAQKLLVGRGCGEAVESGRKIPVGVPGAYESVRTLSEGTHLWLTRFGIAL